MTMPANPVSRFRDDVEGASTAWSIFWTLIFLLIAGFVIDTANAYKYRQVLTATADSASLAALMNYRELHYYGLYDQNDADYYTDDGNAPPSGYTRARNVATNISSRIMGTASNGKVVTDQDVELGNWNAGVFTPWDGVSAKPGKINAARATAFRSSRRADPDDSNPLDTLLMGAFGGLDWWDIAAVSVAESYIPGCYTDGLMAMGKVDMASNNAFYGEICIHGEGQENQGNKNPPVGISLQQNNYFDPDVVVSAPGAFEDMVSGSGSDGTVGDVYQTESLTPSGIQEFDSLRDMLLNPLQASADDIADYMPEYILENVLVDGSPVVGDGDASTRLTEIEIQAAINAITNEDAQWPVVNTDPVTGGPLTATEFENLLAQAAADGTVDETFSGKIYQVSCPGGNNKTVDFDQTVTLSNMAVVSTNCRYSFSSDIVVAGSFLLTDHNGSNASIHGSNGVTIGSGTCAEGTGSKVMARGTIDFSSDMTMVRSQIVSRDEDIYYAAKSDGMDGTSVHAGGNIFLRSQAQAQSCPGAFPDKLVLSREWYRLVQ
ncbi:MAG: Tad domain-containing protein [Rhodobacteraceae bacterium]|nr:Tad domain-containing protein [Paracoccaceae bacterium]